MSQTTQAQRSAIEITGLRKEFDVASGIEVAVDNISLDVGETEFLTIVGPSGCGKTTTLRCIAGLEMPTSGEILFNGHDMTDIPGNKRNIAMMFQNIALYPHMKIIDNIAYPLKVRHVPTEERYETAREAAELMQIPDLLDKYPGELSGGQRQRAALARTVVQQPRAFLMDEPLSDLDAKLKVEMRKEIQRIHKRVEKPTIYVTHDQEEAMTMSDRIVVMNDGNIAQVGTPDELYEQPANLFVAQFIGNPSMNFLDATLTSVDGETVELTIEDKQFTVETVDLVDNPPEDVVIGIRPEDLGIGREGNLEVEVNLIERIGERMLATLSGPQGELRATMQPDRSIQENARLAAKLDLENAHIFDADTGEHIGKGVEA